MKSRYVMQCVSMEESSGPTLSTMRHPAAILITRRRQGRHHQPFLN